MALPEVRLTHRIRSRPSGNDVSPQIVGKAVQRLIQPLSHLEILTLRTLRSLIWPSQTCTRLVIQSLS